MCYNSTTGNYYWYVWGISSAGRAPRLHRGGQRFDPAILHHIDITQRMLSFFMRKKRLI